MAHRSLLAAALLGFGALSCGSGDTVGTFAPVGSEQPAPNPDQPGGNPDQTPPSPEQPPPNPDAPPPGSGSAAQGCASYCQAVASCFRSLGGIPEAEFTVECPAACLSSVAALPICDAQFTALFSCAAANGPICTLDQFEGEDDLEREIFWPACAVQFDAAIDCIDAQDPPDQPDPPDPPDGSTCESPVCACDGDLCDICTCTYGEGSTLCTEQCAEL